MSRKVVITGATGMLGSHLMKSFESAGWKVEGTYHRELPPAGSSMQYADLNDPTTLLDCFQGADTVVHASAMVSYNPARRRQLLEVNGNGTRNVVNACMAQGVRHLIHISSIAAISHREDGSADETLQWNGEDAVPYAESKYLAELEAFRGFEEGLTVSIVNPSLILAGSHQGRSSVTLLDYIWNGGHFYGDGKINYVDVRDVCAAVMTLSEKPSSGERYILNAGQIAVKDLFSAIAQRLNKPAPSYRITPALSYLVGMVSEMFARFTGKEPVLTRQTARLAMRVSHYRNEKSIKHLGISYRPLDETLDWCCLEYMSRVTQRKS